MINPTSRNPARPPIFQKKNLGDLKTISADLNNVEQPSKRIVSSSIIPPPSSIKRTFDIDKIAERIPKSWRPKNDEDEILLTKDQKELLKKTLMKEREEQLDEIYTNKTAEYVDRHKIAMGVKPLQNQPDPNISSMYA